MLRCFTVLAVLAALSLPFYGQSINELAEAEAEERPEAKQALIVATHTGMQAGAQPSQFHIPSTSEEMAWLRPKMIPAPGDDAAVAQQSTSTAHGHGSFNWGGALKQSLLFLGVQHGYAIAARAKTRREMRGPFFKDYFQSVRNLSGWDDGGRFFTNYISHPMEGAITGYIQIQNDPKGSKQEFGKSRAYWISRMKAMAWNAAYSTQFEIGPISQSSIGNVGLHTSLDGKKRKMAYVDLVVTPTIGTAWLVGEDVLDRYVLQRLELKTNRPFTRNAARVLLNPMRGVANMLRFKQPWYRDR